MHHLFGPSVGPIHAHGGHELPAIITVLRSARIDATRAPISESSGVSPPIRARQKGGPDSALLAAAQSVNRRIMVFHLRISDERRGAGGGVCASRSPVQPRPAPEAKTLGRVKGPAKKK